MPPPKKFFLYYPLSSVFTYAKKSLEKFYERDKHFAYFMEKTIALFYIPLHWYLKVCWSYIWCFARFGTISAFEIQVLRKSAIKCRGNFRTLQFASGMRRQKKTAKDSAQTFVHYVGNGFGIPRNFAKGYDLVF